MYKKNIRLTDLKPGECAKNDYYSLENEFLIAKGTLITDQHIILMQKRCIFELQAKESDLQIINDKINEELKTIVQHYEKNKNTQLPIFQSELDYRQELLNEAKADDLDRQSLKPDFIKTPHGESLQKKATQAKFQDRTSTYLSEISNFYEESISVIESIFTSIMAGNRNCLEKTENLIKKIISIYLIDKNILLNISAQKSKTHEHLFYHSLNVTILSINIAASSGYAYKEVMEIGIGALLHDIGMFLIPEKLRFKDDRFDQNDWSEIRKHPILGINILESLGSLPDSVLYISYQNHERQNCSGYPKQRGERFIHNFAKIVQIADIYEAFSTSRPHRTATTPYTAAKNLLYMVQMNLISKDFVRSFFNYMSTFPIGTLVLLSNGFLAKVTDTNRSSISKPTVTVVRTAHEHILARSEMFQINLSEEKDITITRAFSHYQNNRISIMQGF